MGFFCHQYEQCPFLPSRRNVIQVTMLNSSDHICNMTVQCFWLLLVLRRQGRAHQTFTCSVTTWKALSPFHHSFNGHVGKEELSCVRPGSCGKGGRKESYQERKLSVSERKLSESYCVVAQQCGHWGCWSRMCQHGS